jgi:hypothetical protein
MNQPPVKVFWLQPEVVLAAQVNMPGTITYPAHNISYHNVTAGSHTDLEADMLFVLGSTPGADDLGRGRLRPGSTSLMLRIGRASQGFEDGQVDIVHGAYITVLNDFRVWAKIPEIGPAPDYIEYKDAALLVSDNTINPPPVANTGAPYARAIDPDTETIAVALSAAGSYAVADDATITGYLWDVKDGTIILGGSATDASIYVEFPAGFRWVKLTVTDSNGKSHTSRVPILADDPANSLCAGGLQVTNITRTDQGTTARLRVLQDLPRDDYLDGGLVMLWEDRDPSVYGTPEYTTRANLLFTGWHHTEQASSRALETHLQRETELVCVDVAGRLDNLPGFPQRLELPDETEGLTWGEMPAPNMDKFLHYLIHWHSTAASLTDFFVSGTWEQYAFVLFDAVGDTLWNQLARQASRMLPDHALTVDRYGALRVVANPQYQNVGDRTATIQNNITVQSWSELDFGYQRSPRVHTLRANAVLVQDEWQIDTDGKKTLLTAFARAPGLAPAQGGREQTLGERLAPDQQTLNDVAGHHLARMNARYGPVSVNLNANADPWFFDPGAMTWVELIATAETAPPRGWGFTNVRALCREVSVDYSYTEAATLTRARVTLELETVGQPGVTEEQEPALPPGEQPEPPPDLTPYVPDYGLRSGQEKVVAICRDGYVYRTTDFQTLASAGGPTWSRVSMGISEYIYSFVVDPFSPGYINGSGAINGYIATENAIYRLENLFGTLAVTTLHSFATVAPFANGCFRAIGASFGRYFENDADNPWLICVSDYNGIAAKKREWATYSIDAGATWSAEVRTSSNAFTSSSGTTQSNDIDIYLSPKTPGLAITISYSTNLATAESYVTTDWGATWAKLDYPDLNIGRYIGGPIHVPWPDNDDEALVYHGWLDIVSSAHHFRLKRVNGTSITDISPSDGTRYYGPLGRIFGVRTFDSNRQYVVMAGYGSDSSTNRALDHHRVFASSDYGDTWTSIYTGAGGAEPSASFAKYAAFAGDTEQAIFMWGSRCNIRYTNDFGANVDNKVGNIATLNGGTLPDHNFIGIAGGPTA